MTIDFYAFLSEDDTCIENACNNKSTQYNALKAPQKQVIKVNTVQSNALQPSNTKINKNRFYRCICISV